MFIRAKTVLGVRDINGNSPIYPGSVAEVTEEVGKRLVSLCVAQEVSGSASDRPCNISPVSGTSVNPSAGESAQNGPKTPENDEGMISGHLVKSDLEEMTYTQLKELAKDMGIETGRIKSKAAMNEATRAEEV